VARDDEFRKVAEDIGALARSLGRDFREAVDQAVRGGYPPGRAVRHGLRGLRDEARRGMRSGWTGHQGHWRGGPWGCGGTWSRGPGPVTPAGEPGPPGSEFTGSPPGPGGPPWARGRPWSPAGSPPAGLPWGGPSWNRPRRQQPPRPPIRHRWDATTVLGMLAVLFGVAWLIGATGVLHVSIEAVVAIGLMLLGASLVVTGRTDWSLSRRSWPVWFGVGLIALLVATSTTFGVAGALNSISFGSKNVTVAGPTNGVIHGGFGDLTVNVSNVPKADETLKIVSVAGRTIVNTPPAIANYDVVVKGRVVGGQICIEGTDVADGVAAQFHSPSATRSPTLTLDVHQMFGQILINGQGCSHR
jgi:hypothetical protein